MEKFDLARQFKTYYTAGSKPSLLEIDKAVYLSIIGKGEPGGGAFTGKIQALYGVIYKLKFIYKGLGKDFSVAKLEGLWSFDEARHGNPSMAEAPLVVPRSEWVYRLMIRIPDYVEQGQVEAAIRVVADKKGNGIAEEVGLFVLEEGLVVQMLHVGPFSTEPASLEKILEFTRANSLARNGLHHEIYLSDFNKTAPDKLKTILREPVKRV